MTYLKMALDCDNYVIMFTKPFLRAMVAHIVKLVYFTIILHSDNTYIYRIVQDNTSSTIQTRTTKPPAEDSMYHQMEGITLDYSFNIGLPTESSWALSHSTQKK